VQKRSESPADPRELRRQTPVTDQEHERLRVDRRQDEAQKSYHTIIEQQIQQAQEDLERPALALLLSGLAAGLDLGLGPLLMCVVLTLASGELSHTATQLLLATAYSFGFVFVVIGRSALFTEQTTSAVMPVLARRVNAVRLVRLWALVLAANLVGAALIAAIGAFLGPALGIFDQAAMQEIAQKLVSKDSLSIALSAVLAGWVMGLLSWLVVAARDTTSQILIVFMTTFLIGVVGLHHSIAGTVEVLLAVFAQAGTSWSDFGRFIVLAAAGNAVGGSVFVALLKFGHVSASVER
jgi:formate/nitrite transporter FocA (FNT family)